MKIPQKKSNTHKGNFSSSQFGNANGLNLSNGMNGYENDQMNNENDDEDNDILYHELNDSNNPIGNSHHTSHPPRHQSDLTSGDVLSIQSDDNIIPSQQLRSQTRYPQDNVVDSYEFDGYSPSHKVEYNDIDGRLVFATIG